MTKRLVIAVSFLLIAFIASIVSHIYLDNISAEIIAAAEKAEEGYIQGSDSDTEKLLNIWEENKHIFAILLKHTDTDTIDRYFYILRENLENGNSEAVFAVIKELKAFTKVTVDGEKPKIENIF